MSAQHWQEATRPTVLLDGSQSFYGFGLSLKPSPLGHKRITHGGHWRGFKTELTLLPEMDTVIVLLTNNGEDDSVEDARDAIEAILAGKPTPIVLEPFQWQLADHVATDSLSKLRRWLLDAKSHAQGIDLAEKEVNNIGYALLERKQLDKATAVFEFNHLAHPNSTNAMDSLADAYVAIGEMAKAKEQIQAILAIDPDSKSAIKRLSELSK